jgi:AcrR family transcriptional regulator
VKSGTKRKYELKRRAERQEETRRRIIETVVALHEEVGPARTTVAEIARRADVGRPTVYAHFPDEGSLFRACAGHWGQANPRPDPAAWARIADPELRLRKALGQLYAWYEAGERMLANIARDAALMPAVAEAASEFRAPYYNAALEVLADGAPERGGGQARLRAALGHALEFETWRSLVRRHGLTQVQAVELMVALVRLGRETVQVSREERRFADVAGAGKLGRPAF